MPGLLRGVARTAVIAGTASAVSGRVQRRQSERFAERDARAAAEWDRNYQEEASRQAPPPAAPAGPAAEDRLARLERLSSLLEQGVLTQEEFAAEKARILQS